eukprot:s10736_g1.t1
MLWLEEPVRLLLQKSNADVLVLAACQYDWNISKRWAFATTFRDMQQLAKDCPHKEGAHAPVAGVRDAFGGFVSQQTAEFPAALAQAYCKSVAADLSLDQLYQLLPIKGQFDMPVAHQDGAGIFSVPDWSFPPSGMQDRLKPVRQALLHKLFEIRAPLRLREHVQARAESPLFTDAEVESFRAIFADFMEANTARKVDWSIQSFQPYTLRALQQLSEALEDPDRDLFACLQEGVTFQGRTFFYRVMPFGMSCSAYWWQRLSAFFVRTWHLLLFLADFLSMYVDDLILAMSTGALDVSACLLLAFAASFRGWPSVSRLGADLTSNSVALHGIWGVSRLWSQAQGSGCCGAVVFQHLDVLAEVFGSLRFGGSGLVPFLCTAERGAGLQAAITSGFLGPGASQLSRR